MKRLFMIILLSIVSLSLGGACNNVSQKSLSDFMEKTCDYVRMLDVNADPILIDHYDNRYVLKIEKGKPIKLIDLTGPSSTSLSLENSENLVIAERMKEDSAQMLGILQICLEENYYENLVYDASIESIVLVHATLKEEGIKLFPTNLQIARASITIPLSKAEKAKGAVLVGCDYRIPNGIKLNIDLENGVVVYYEYGEAYNQTPTTISEILEHS